MGEVYRATDTKLNREVALEVLPGNPESSPTLTMRATMAGVIMGRGAYMSPEQAKGKPVDRRADIWAFGVVLSEMLTGRALYTGETVVEILAAVIMKAPRFPENVPPFVRQLLRRGLDRGATQRPPGVRGARVAPAEAPPGIAPCW